MDPAESALRTLLVKAVAHPSGTSVSDILDVLVDSLAENGEEVVGFLVERKVLRQVPLEALGTRLPRLFEIA